MPTCTTYEATRRRVTIERGLESPGIMTIIRSLGSIEAARRGSKVLVRKPESLRPQRAKLPWCTRASTWLPKSANSSRLSGRRGLWGRLWGTGAAVTRAR